MVKGRKLVAADLEEAKSLTGNGPTTIIVHEQSNSAVWKVFTLVLAGIVILFMTDAIEIKTANSAGPDNAATSTSTSTTSFSEELHHETLPAATTVELKPVLVETVNTEDTPDIELTQPPTPAEPEVAAGGTASDTVDQPETTTEDNEQSAPETTVIPETTPATSGTTPATPQTTPVASSGDDEFTARHTYARRGQPLSDEDRQAMIGKWGSWTLVDTKDRPTQDIYKKYPNRDIPRSDFPLNAWQIDKEYLDAFLPEALALVQRAQEGILAEYGKTEGTWQNRTQMFNVERFESLEGQAKLTPRRGKGGRGSVRQGGWTTNKSWEALIRRVLHAIMTEDGFVFAMGGHSAAAGHGNHFQQSYTLQVQWILEAVFARLGVKHQARNFGNGGLGTVQHGIAAGSIYGPDVDMLMWDSGMTEPDPPAKDLQARQALLGGIKVPVLWTLAANEAKTLNLYADADVGYVGDGSSGISKGESLEEIEKMPWAMQYVKCSNDMHGICRKNEYRGICWIERDDYTPDFKQSVAPGGRASWHPGDRIHQVKGRILAFTILTALKDALTVWKEAPNYELPDEAWHVTAHYENIRTKVADLPDDVGECLKKFGDKNMSFVCKYPMKGRTEFTPRSYPGHTNVRSLMHPDMSASIISGNGHKPVYDPPDSFNPTLHPPPGEIDVLSMVEAGVDFKSVLAPDYTYFYKTPSFTSPPKVPVGKGINLNAPIGDWLCDGSVDSWCKKGGDNNCLLYNHNDGRNGLLFDGYSGWIVMVLPDVKNGFIAVKYESWHWASETKTEGWTSVNNETRALYGSGSNSRRLLAPSPAPVDIPTVDTRMLKKNVPVPKCDEFRFEYAIDGEITSLSLEEWVERSKKVQRVVEVMTLLEDPSYTGGEEKEVEIAVRIVGCGRDKVFSLNHVYWS